MNENLEIKIKKLYQDSILPTKKYENDAGFDCYVHHFIEISHLETTNNIKKIHHVVSGISTYSSWNLEPIISNSINLEDKCENIIGCALGFATVIPKGYYAQLVPRSGLSIEHGITIVNSPATIDEGYRGEWVAIIGNVSKFPYRIKIGDRIAQLILRKMIPTKIIEVDSLEESERDENGFGSSGK